MNGDNEEVEGIKESYGSDTHEGLANITYFFFRTPNARSISFLADSCFSLYKIHLWSSSAGSGIVLTSVPNSDIFRQQDSIPMENDPNLFFLKVNNGGAFTYVLGPKRTMAPRHVYKGGNADWFDDINVDGFYVIEVSGMVRELGYENPQMKFHYKKPNSDLDKGLEPLNIDAEDSDDLGNGNVGLGTQESDDLGTPNVGTNHDNLDDVNVGLGNDNVDEFDPLFSYPDTNHEIGQSSKTRTSLPNETDDVRVDIEGSDNSEESDDSDFECDIEDQINDIYVDMKLFRKYTDPGVEWDFDSETDSDKDEAERGRALKKISKCHKPVDGELYTKNFHVSQTFANKQLIKYMVTRFSVEKRRELYLTRNDNERVRAECRGVVLVFYNNGPSDPSGSNNVGLSDGPSGS
ncbi:hypothetical protein Tco_0722387 [Tanacetum coccineum]